MAWPVSSTVQRIGLGPASPHKTQLNSFQRCERPSGRHAVPLASSRSAVVEDSHSFVPFQQTCTHPCPESFDVHASPACCAKSRAVEFFWIARILCASSPVMAERCSRGCLMRVIR